MVTKIGRNHYGLFAESVDHDKKIVYHTMRVYSGNIVTREYRILKEEDGMRVSEPTNVDRAHAPVKRLTPMLLREIHAKHVNELRA